MEEKNISPEQDLIYRIVEQWGNVINMPKMEGWLKEYAATRQTGAAWVKASEPPTHERYIPIRFADCTYKVAAFTTDHMLKESQPYWMYSRHDPINTLLEFEWYNDENGTAAGREEDAVKKEVIDFIRDIAENWDCDEDGHKYNTGCRKCSASELYYELSKQQKEK